MTQVFIIIWLGKPEVFCSYAGARKWLLSKVPYLSEFEIRMSIYVREVYTDDEFALKEVDGVLQEVEFSNAVEI